ncbi:hypothetical protein [Streptomyces werraensis]|uniref:hypothetical protein n=1 Tax=Streptomyces werraensis TaxID=68284 RepID=UPI0036FF4046
MASVAEERETTDVGSLPVDVETISANVELAWAMKLDSSTREVIDLRTKELIGYLNLLRSEELDEFENRDTQRLLKIVDRHLSMDGRPTRLSPAYEAFNFMKDTAVFVKSMLATYQRVHGIP